MCTLTWLRDTSGYVLLFNRDERKTRGPERPPQIVTRGERRAIWPSDSDAGGTWMAVSDSGVTVCVLNGYQASDDLPETASGQQVDTRRSRGLLVRDLAHSRTSSEVLERLHADDPARYRSFVLFVMDADAPAEIVEWDGISLEVRTNAENALPLISSAIRSQAVRASRQATFDALRQEHGGVDEALLRAYHASHREGPSPHSPCMHHELAETRSHSVVRVTGAHVSFEHTPGPLCRAATPTLVQMDRVIVSPSGA